MLRHARLLILAVAVLCLGATSYIPAHASSPVVSHSSVSTSATAHRVAQYSVRAVGQDQCFKPLKDRVGPWVCPVGKGVSLKTIEGTDCTYGGDACWYVQGTYRARNEGNWAWGIAGRFSGTARFWQLNTLNGPEMRSQTSLIPNGAAMDSLRAQGFMLWGGENTDGTVFIDDVGCSGTECTYITDQTKTKDHLSSNTAWFPWGQQSSTNQKAGFRAADDVRGNHANMIKYSWSRDDYPGLFNWWIYMKANIAHAGTGSDDYKYIDPFTRFNSSYDGGGPN